RACLDCTLESPHFDFANPEWEIYTRHRHLSPTNLRGGTVKSSLICEGCQIAAASLEHCVVGIRSVVGAGARIKDTILMGSDYYETLEHQTDNLRHGVPNMGIGKDVVIERAIIDKNTRIGDG